MSDKKVPTPPDEHRFTKDIKICDPFKTDRTDEMDDDRVGRIATEFEEGFELLKKYKLAATFFGSARYAVGHEICSEAEDLASRLAKSGFAIITGGAGGVMEAANKGAHSANGQSIGLNISLPEEQGSNEYLSDSKTFNYFFTRKVMLAYASEVYVFFPGGFGTLDEMFEILTLVQTKKIKKIPIVLYDREYWGPFIDLFKKQLLEKYQTISAKDLDLFVTVDTVDEAYDRILELVEC